MKKRGKTDLIEKLLKKEIFPEKALEILQEEQGQNLYEYSTDWFSPHIPIWTKIFEKHGFLDPKKTLKCLEIGSWEGRSSVFILKNLCQSKKSTLFCLDTFRGSIEHTQREHNKKLFSMFCYNMFASGQEDQVQILKGFSRNSLRFLLTKITKRLLILHI